MARQGLRSTDLAALTGGRVSVASIRAWARAETLPTRRLAFAVADVLNEDGPHLLDSWGFPELVEALDLPEADELAQPLPPTPEPKVLTYEAPPDSPRRVPIGHKVEATVIARYDDRYLIRTSTGMTLWCEPIESIEWASWADDEG